MGEEILPPEILCTTYVLHDAPPMCPIIRNYLVVKSSLSQRIGSRAYLGLKIAMYTEPSDQKQTQELVEAFQNKPVAYNAHSNCRVV